jgi:hypothetical protein
MIPDALRSFLALFTPGFLASLPIFIFISTYIPDFGKYAIVLIIPFSYAVGWLIYEYCYYTKRKKFHEIRYKSWLKHIANIKLDDKNNLVHWVNSHHSVDISTCVHLASSLVYHKGSEALIQRLDYYVNSFRLLVCLPFSILLGFSICFIFSIINSIIYLVSGNTPSNYILLEAISKKGFWFKIAAAARFKPEAYSSISRI